MLIKLESRFRWILYWFVSYSFLSALYRVVFDAPSVKTGILAFIIPFSFAVGYVIKKEIEEFFETDWDWNPVSWVHRLQNDFILFVGVCALYYMSQVGLMILFFPEFETIRWFGLQAYSLLFLCICVLVFSFYKHLIIPQSALKRFKE